MVRANSPKVKLDVQARFEQVLDSPYGEVKASMPTAFAAKDNVSATVEVIFSSFLKSSFTHCLYQDLNDKKPGANSDNDFIF